MASVQDDADYAPNSRETFRRQVLHQFVQSRIAEYNPFESRLPTNSPHAHYAIAEAALYTVRHSGTSAWQSASHGPIMPKRLVELESILDACRAGPIYVSAFPDFAVFRKHMNHITWATEVWLCDTPDHMVHFDGDRFLGPRD